MCVRFILHSQCVGLFFHFTIPATPSHWRSEFIVMVTAVCIIHARVVVLMTSGLQEPTQLLVTLSVCVTDIDAGLVTKYTRNSFLFVVWPILIALCIARHLISPRSQPLEMASNGTGQSNRETVIWYWGSKEMSAGLFMLAMFLFLVLLFLSYFTIFCLLVGFPLGHKFTFSPSSWLILKLTKMVEQANRNNSENMHELFVWFSQWTIGTWVGWWYILWQEDHWNHISSLSSVCLERNLTGFQNSNTVALLSRGLLWQLCYHQLYIRGC